MANPTATRETFQPYLFINCSHWGLFPYTRAWDGSYPLEQQAEDYGFEVHDLYEDGDDE